MSTVVRDAQGRVVGGSLNPGGRPKSAPHMRKRCRDIVDDRVIDAWAEEVASRGDDWVKCSELLAAYGYGPAKALDPATPGLDGSVSPIQELSVDELRALARQSLADDVEVDADAGDDDDADETVN